MAAPIGKHSFGTQTGQLKQFRVGEHKGVAAKLSEMTGAVNRNSAVLDPPSQIDRLLIPQFQMFKLDMNLLHTHGWDFVMGRAWNGELWSNEKVTILKPWFLRGTYWNTIGDAGKDPARNDITYTYIESVPQQRTAHKDGESDEIQRIIPSYETRDVIVAMRGIHGGFDVTEVSSNTPPIDRHPERAEWMDINVDGRMWAKV